MYELFLNSSIFFLTFTFRNRRKKPKENLAQDCLNVTILKLMFVLVTMVTPFCNVHQIFNKSLTSGDGSLILYLLNEK
jgi:hypothetical protein